MSAADHTRWKDDVAAYALGVLEPGEALELERHLDDCAECRAELRWLRPAVDLLPSSVERVEPPLELRAKILDQARSEPGPAAPSAERSSSGRRGWLSGWRPVAAAGAVALLLAAAGGYAIRGGDSTGGGDDHRRRRQGARGYGKAGDGGRLRDPAPRQRRRDAARTGSSRPGCSAKAKSNPCGGLFVPDRDGRATAMIPDMHGVEAVMVTSEPAGGSETPTSSPLVTAKIETG